jgi:anti-sigma B factor antagonist
VPEEPIHPDRTVPYLAAPPADFRCTQSDGGLGVVWVRVAGELDIASASQLAQTLAHAEGRARRVVLDLRELTFMDTSGVHAIVDASVSATAAGRRLVVVRGASQVDRMLALTGARDRLDIVDLDPGEPPVQAFVQPVGQERAA